MNSIGKTVVGALIAAAMMTAAGQAMATDRNVPGQYPTIQAAVDAANSGDNIKLAPGTFSGPGNEEITVTKQLNFQGANSENISQYTGNPATESVISGGVSGIDFQAGSSHSRIQNISIINHTGFGVQTSPTITDFQAEDMLFQNDGTALHLNGTLHSNFQIRECAFVSNKIGILSDLGLTDTHIQQNTFTKDSAQAILIQLPQRASNFSQDTNLQILQNTLTNDASIEVLDTINSTILQNTSTSPNSDGIIVGSGCEDDFVQQNTVTNGAGNGILAASTPLPGETSPAPVDIILQQNTLTGNNNDGIDVQGAVDFTIFLNTANDNLNGIVVESNSSSVHIALNKTDKNLANGLELVTVSNSQILANEGSGNANDGLLVTLCSNLTFYWDVENNNTFNGIEFVNTTNCQVRHEQADNNGEDGVLLNSSSTGNTFQQNQFGQDVAHKNAHFDAEDQSTGSGTAGTGNTWPQDGQANIGQTSSPNGLLKQSCN